MSQKTGIVDTELLVVVVPVVVILQDLKKNATFYLIPQISSHKHTRGKKKNAF